MALITVYLFPPFSPFFSPALLKKKLFTISHTGALCVGCTVSALSLYARMDTQVHSRHTRAYYAVETSDAMGTPCVRRFGTEAEARQDFENQKRDGENYGVMLLHYARGDEGIGEVSDAFRRPIPTICAVL